MSQQSPWRLPGATALALALVMAATAPDGASAQVPSAPAETQEPDTDASDMDYVFRLGEIVNVAAPAIGVPGVAGSLITRDQTWTFEKSSLEQAVSMIPGVVGTFADNGRRNESDIFVRGFGRLQVPLMIDGVRVYLPADNRLDLARFLTADIASIQIQKGYSSVLDGPGAMGGAINLVTVKPVRPFEAEAGVSAGGRGFEGWNTHVMVGSRQERYYAQGSLTFLDRDAWSLSGNYEPTATSLQPKGERIASNSRDSRVNLKFGFTPTASNEYAINYVRQDGEKGGPVNVYNNPPIPGASFWTWPEWNVQSIAFLSNTQIGTASYLKAKVYYNTLDNLLSSFDDLTYTTQSQPRGFNSPYDDHAYGVGLEAGTTPAAAHTVKAALHYRGDVHREESFNRPTHPTLSNVEPRTETSQYTWAVAVEDTLRVSPAIDLVGGLAYEAFEVTRAEDFSSARGIFGYPTGGSGAMNWQAAAIWRYSASHEVHASVSNRTRLPTFHELFSTRFGTATPNPDLGAERATNLEIGWKGLLMPGLNLSGAVFYSDVRDVIQTVVLADDTTQYQNVGNGEFFGVELELEAAVSDRLTAGGNYTLMNRAIRDALIPELRPTGVPTSKAFLYAAWRVVDRLIVTPSLEAADDRWSDINPNPPVPPFPYVKTGGHALLNLDATYELPRNVDVAIGVQNLADQNYELAWGYPQPGRTFYTRLRAGF
ncbi:MAG: TonB-dependent receptor plug domain-containing protein [Vicinamibacterales bacterium]